MIYTAVGQLFLHARSESAELFAVLPSPISHELTDDLALLGISVLRYRSDNSGLEFIDDLTALLA